MERFGYVTFCDDVRTELGGKRTLVGVYATKLLTNEFPATLSKFCVIANFIAPKDDPATHITVNVLLNDELISEFRVPQNDEASLHVVDDEPNMTARAHMIFAPFEIAQPGEIRVEIIDDRGTDVCITPPLQVAKFPE